MEDQPWPTHLTTLDDLQSPDIFVSKPPGSWYTVDILWNAFILSVALSFETFLPCLLDTRRFLHSAIAHSRASSISKRESILLHPNYALPNLPFNAIFNSSFEAMSFLSCVSSIDQFTYMYLPFMNFACSVASHTATPPDRVKVSFVNCRKAELVILIGTIPGCKLTATISRSLR